MPTPEPVFDKAGRERWPRDAQVAAKALHLSGYKWAYDETHTSFTSKITGYLEIHHLVPMKFQGSFNVSLDRTAQLLALCSTCHRQIHYGTDEGKAVMLRELFYKYVEKLEKIGIEIGYKDLQKMYGIKEDCAWK